MRKKIGKIIKSIVKGITTVAVTITGICGWLFTGCMQIVTISLIVGVVGVVGVYTYVKPDLDHCREVAYDKLSNMQREDFSLLSDTEIYDKNGDLIGIINAGHYEYVPINEISTDIQNIYIAQEDRRFKSHTGVDWIATFRAGLALVKNKGSITQGGSTITQQVIKNTYLTQEKSFTRKIVEILLAPQIEKKYSKADIMEFYCNTNFYGNHCYGVQAASRFYFGKDAKDITESEAAVLAGLSNSPSAYDPIKHPEAALEKRNDVLLSAYEVGYLSEKEYEKAIEEPLHIVQEQGAGTNENYQMSYAIHCAALELMKAEGFEFQYLFKDEADYNQYMDKYDEEYKEKNNKIREGGYKIYTSLDPALQSVIQDEIDQTLAPYGELQDNGKYAMQGAGVIVDNQTNYVVAIVGGRGTEDIFNRAFLSARQPGSTIKPLLDYAPAFDTGEYYPAKIMDDHKWDGGPSNSGGRYYGNITIREALNRSLNTVAWQVLDGIGIENGLHYLEKMQFQKISYIDNNVESLSIGGFTNGLRVVDMAKGYSTLANNGVYDDKTCITGITHEHDGDLLKNQKNITKKVYESDTAFMITDILKGTLNEEYGTGHGLALENGMIAAGKTGTTNSNKDTWFCGYTKYYTAAIWVGYDIPRAMPGIYGSTYAGKIWKNTMDRIHEGKEALDWDIPSTIELRDYPTLGREDYVSIMAEKRAEIAEKDKEQKQLCEQIESSLSVFETETIGNVEDTYMIKKAYQDILDKINSLDAGEAKNQFMVRLQRKYNDFTAIINNMQETIRLYERQKEREAEEQLKADQEKAKQDRKLQEEDARRKECLNAIVDVEKLEYQSRNAESLIQTAISKLPLVETYSYAKEYSSRLNIAIKRVKTLPTEAEWNRIQEEKKAKEEAAKQAELKRIQEEQEKLNETLEKESSMWNQAPAPGTLMR